MNVLVIGAGKMGSAMISAWVNCKKIRPSRITIVEKKIVNINRLKKISSEFKISRDIPKKWKGDFLIFAVKPQDFKNLIRDMKYKDIIFNNIISIMAGIKTERIRTVMDTSADITRVMPNLAVQLNLGVSCIFHIKKNNSRRKKIVNDLFSTLGTTFQVKEEKLLDAVTAVSGSGPAYFLLFLLEFEKISTELGFSKKLSKNIVFSTIEGAFELAKKRHNIQSLINSITSKNGTTEAALKILEKNNSGLYTLMKKAIYAAKNKADKISKSI